MRSIALCFPYGYTIYTAKLPSVVARQQSSSGAYWWDALVPCCAAAEKQQPCKQGAVLLRENGSISASCWWALSGVEVLCCGKQ